MQENASVFENLRKYMPGQDQQGIVTLGMIYEWEALWNKEATEEQVALDERREYIDEVMIEITQKLKRKHQLDSMGDFKILGWEDNSALLQYPKLTGDKDALRNIGTLLLKTGVVEQLSVFVDGVMLDVFDTNQR